MTRRRRQSLTGPAACLRSRSRPDLVCDTCHGRALDGTIHIPMRLRGRFCSTHCPACNPRHGKPAPAAVVELQGALPL